MTNHMLASPAQYFLTRQMPASAGCRTQGRHLHRPRLHILLLKLSLSAINTTATATIIVIIIIISMIIVIVIIPSFVSDMPYTRVASKWFLNTLLMCLCALLLQPGMNA